jgi:hypothetical protein
MRLRWSIIFAALHLSLVTPMMVLVEMSDWPDVTEVQRHEIRRQQKNHAAPFTEGQIEWDCTSADRWPSAQETAIQLGNLPASIIVGWNRHPVSLCLTSVVKVLSKRFEDYIPLRAGIVAFDCVFIVSIGFQWWMIGRWCKAALKTRLHNMVLIAALLISVCSFVEFVLTTSSRAGNVAYIFGAVGALQTLAWVWLFCMFMAALWTRFYKWRISRRPATQE